MISMKRTERIEAMARAAWEASDEPEPWADLPCPIRSDWMNYQEAALERLEQIVPDVRVAVSSVME